MADRWSDMLRVVGRWLDSEGAENVQISADKALDVTWKRGGGTGELATASLDMDKLRAQAPLMRQPINAPSQRGDREELLRTLGQELDDLGYRVERVFERTAGYEVVVFEGDTKSQRFYSLTELRQMSERRREQRGSQPPSATE